eukprot:CAMPEP_0194269120 /NCGR_PEP_ID=MMETSP0169-20130528/3332_1 /TAXON_ID=218684 /ORGANISM="Corethron pennatum, Strain L29A3" /LENGTH=284 /DNA_ID=CAMNT_0039010643 /DNA_START=37 /DNA_END=894 /DNA_ORIENTATION=-
MRRFLAPLSISQICSMGRVLAFQIGSRTFLGSVARSRVSRVTDAFPATNRFGSGVAPPGMVRGNSIFERVLETPKWPEEWCFTEEDFRKQDESSDAIFYANPRLVCHIDEAAVGAVKQYYGEVFDDGQDVLDICSSWVSHFPPNWKGGNVVGLGMNESELKENPVLTSYDVRDLNENPAFPYDDGSFDVVTCVVSIDYLMKPREIFAEIGRVLRPGGSCILSLSNRCFPTKVFQLWLQTGDMEHIFIVGSFFHYSGLFEKPKCVDMSPNPGLSDPLFIVTATKK